MDGMHTKSGAEGSAYVGDISDLPRIGEKEGIKRDFIIFWHYL